MAVATRTAAVSPPGTAASRSPTRITAPSARSASATFGASPSRPVPPASASSQAVSVPGAAGSSVPPALVRPRVAWLASENTFWPCLRHALRSRRKTPGASSSASKPASSTAGAFSSVV